jgi:L-fuculose-phosphate aldolase
MSESQKRAEVADYSQRLHARGWVANHDGNLSVRLEPGRYLCTPTATSKAEVRADGLVIVDESGARVSGRGKPFSEIGLHLTVFRNRPDVNAVVHAHPPTATGFACAGVALDQAFIAEAVVSLGPGVPTVPYAAPGEAACQALAPFVSDYDAVLLANHGVLAWGTDLEQAYLRCELVEHLARIALVARQLGGVRPIPSSNLPALLEARAKAGLGPRSRSAAAPAAPSEKKVVVACAPAPPGSDVEVYDPKRAVVTNPSSDLATIIRQEIINVLKSS